MECWGVGYNRVDKDFFYSVRTNSQLKVINGIQMLTKPKGGINIFAKASSQSPTSGSTGALPLLSLHWTSSFPAAGFRQDDSQDGCGGAPLHQGHPGGPPPPPAPLHPHQDEEERSKLHPEGGDPGRPGEGLPHPGPQALPYHLPGAWPPELHRRRPHGAPPLPPPLPSPPSSPPPS